MLYYNIAEAYFWMSQWDNSEQYINKAINGGALKFKSAAKRLQTSLNVMKIRWDANF